MRSHEAMKECIGKFVEEVARRVRRSKHLVYKWMEPTEDPDDSGARNPADVLDEVIDEAKRRGQGERALAPLYWLNNEHGLVCYKMPGTTSTGPIVPALVDAIKEFGEFAQATSEALADNRISTLDRKRITKEGMDAIRAIATLVAIAEENVS